MAIFKRLSYILPDLFKKINKIFNPYQITVLVGSESTLVSAYFKEELQEAFFIPTETKQYDRLEQLNNFLKRYRNAKLYLFIDNTESFVKNVDLATLGGLLPANTVSDFADKEFRDDHIYSYRVNSQYSSSLDRLQVTFAATPIDEIINFWLERIFKQNILKFGGIYFLSLEANNILTNLTKNYTDNHLRGLQEIKLLTADIKVFVFVAKTTGIRIFALKNQNLLINRKANYPVDRSDDYIVGTIEHELNEVLLNLKHVIHPNEELIVDLVLIADDKIVKLLKEQKYKFADQVILSINEVSSEKSQNFTNTFDEVLAGIMLKNRLYPAGNKQLKSLLNLRVLNRLWFRPFLVALFILAVGNLYLSYRINNNKNNIARVSQEYSNNLLEYRKLKGYFTETKYPDQAIEVALAKAKLAKDKITFFETISKFLKIENGNIEVKDVKWQKTFQNSSKDFSLIIRVKLKCFAREMNKANFSILVENYRLSLVDSLQGFNISFLQESSSSISKSGKISQPITIIISS